MQRGTITSADGNIKSLSPVQNDGDKIDTDYIIIEMEEALNKSGLAKNYSPSCLQKIKQFALNMHSVFSAVGVPISATSLIFSISAILRGFEDEKKDSTIPLWYGGLGVMVVASIFGIAEILKIEKFKPLRAAWKAFFSTTSTTMFELMLAGTLLMYACTNDEGKVYISNTAFALFMSSLGVGGLLNGTATYLRESSQLKGRLLRGAEMVNTVLVATSLTYSFIRTGLALSQKDNPDPAARLAEVIVPSIVMPIPALAASYLKPIETNTFLQYFGWVGISLSLYMMFNEMTMDGKELGPVHLMILGIAGALISLIPLIAASGQYVYQARERGRFAPMETTPLNAQARRANSFYQENQPVEPEKNEADAALKMGLD